MTGAYIVTLNEIVQRGFEPDKTDVFFMVMKKDQPVPYCYCCGMLELYKYWRKDNHSVCPPDDAMLLQVVLYSHGSIALPRVYDRFQAGKIIDYADESRYLWLVRRCGTNLIPMSAVPHSDVVEHYLESRRNNPERANEIARFYEVDAKTLSFKAIRNGQLPTTKVVGLQRKL